jgi:hypothetical protein
MRRFSKPQERWPKTKKLVTYFVLLLLVLGMAGRPLAKGVLFYQSYWGGAVFVPVIFVLAALIVVIAVIDLRKKLERGVPPTAWYGRATKF